MLTGHCNCGAVAFEANCDASEVIICHCSVCRRSTGSNGIAVVIVDKAAFQWRCGVDKITRWKKPDADWHTAFCQLCGSPLPGENDASRLYIPAGLLSHGAEALSVTHHIWVHSKASWDLIGDCGKQHPGAFEAPSSG